MQGHAGQRSHGSCHHCGVLAVVQLLVVPSRGGAVSSLWTQYETAKAAGTATILADFSYAGYRHGEPVHTGMPTHAEASHYARVIGFAPIAEVGVEEIAFFGNWKAPFVHHAH